MSRNTKSSKSEFMTLAQVASEFHLSVKSIQRRIAKGQFAPFRRIGAEDAVESNAIDGVVHERRNADRRSDAAAHAKGSVKFTRHGEQSHPMGHRVATVLSGNSGSYLRRGSSVAMHCAKESGSLRLKTEPR